MSEHRIIKIIIYPFSSGMLSSEHPNLNLIDNINCEYKSFSPHAFCLETASNNRVVRKPIIGYQSPVLDKLNLCKCSFVSIIGEYVV